MKRFVCFVLLFTFATVNPFKSNDECWSKWNEKDEFRRINMASRYLFLNNGTLMSVNSSIKFCEDKKLEVTKIKNRKEFWKIAEFVLSKTKSMGPFSGPFRLSLGKLEMKLHTMDKHLDFQSFNLNDGVYYKPGYKCLALEGRDDKVYYVPIRCNQTKAVVPFCQFRKKSKCYDQLPGDEKEVQEDLKLEFLGYRKGRNYHGSNIQATWYEAMETCRRHQFILLDISNKTMRKLPEMFQIADGYFQYRALRYWEATSWTSGQYQSTDKIKFETNGEEFAFSKLGGLVYKNFTEDYSYEKCFAVVPNKAPLRPILCNMVTYFICYENYTAPEDKRDRSSQQVSTTSEEFYY